MIRSTDAIRDTFSSPKKKRPLWPALLLGVFAIALLIYVNWPQKQIIKPEHVAKDSAVHSPIISQPHSDTPPVNTDRSIRIGDGNQIDGNLNTGDNNQLEQNQPKR